MLNPFGHDRGARPAERHRRRCWSGWVALGLAASSITTAGAAETLPVRELRTMALKVIGPIPLRMPGGESDTPALVKLGRELYFDKALSQNSSQSCHTCHPVENGKGGMDNEATSLGAFGKRGGRNAPTTLNAGFQFAQFWDGRATDLVAQARSQVLSPVDMAMREEVGVVNRLSGMSKYSALFREAFPEANPSITYEHMARAIAAFERTLVTRDRLDDFLNGDDQALSGLQQRGLHEFLTLGCATCHSGPVVGGQAYRKLGLVNPHPTEDEGRSAVTKDEEDQYKFKVPMLRNVALTHPYFHKGQVSTLDEAVRKMTWHQLGKELSNDQVQSLVAFLRSMTDKARSKL